MSDNKLATKDDLKEMYNRIYPYLGGLTTSKAGFTPIGTIISVMGTTAPVNYLACDGTVYNIADYTELANYFNEQFGSKNFFGGDGTTTFAVPDLRGEFLRGTGTNSHENQGNGANVGVHQDATANPYFIYNGTAGMNIYDQAGSETSPKNMDSRYSSGNTGRRLNSEESWTGTYNVLYTSRPTNTSVLYCIATKNFYIDPTLDYSTDEKVVGTWIDGKPLYQKTWVVPSVTLGTWIVIDTLSDLETLASLHVLNKQAMGAFNEVSNTGTSDAWFYITSEKKLRYFISSSNKMGITAQSVLYVTIQYTKTTGT